MQASRNSIERWSARVVCCRVVLLWTWSQFGSGFVWALYAVCISGITILRSHEVSQGPVLFQLRISGGRHLRTSDKLGDLLSGDTLPACRISSVMSLGSAYRGAVIYAS